MTAIGARVVDGADRAAGDAEHDVDPARDEDVEQGVGSGDRRGAWMGLRRKKGILEHVATPKG
jgi:hypothetical protein